MERQARCTRRSLGQVQTRLPAIFQVTCVLLAFCGSPAAAEGLGCTSGDFITSNHMRALEDLIGNQARDSCDVTFSFMPLPGRDADYRHKACYVIAATPAVKRILQTQQNSYKSKSTNHNHSGFLLKLLDEFRDRKCFVSQNRKQECYRTLTKSPADMLTMVKDYLSLTKEVLPINISPRDCEDVYAACKDPDQGENHKKEETTTTPDIAQCQCSCPTSGSTSSTLSSIKAIAASPEAAGMKKPTPTQFMPLASRQGGARVARTLQNLPATPDSLQSPETPRTPTVSTSPSTVATEALSITDALEPTLRGTRRPPGLILGSHQTSTPGSVTEKIPIGSTEEPVSETTETTVYQPSTEDIIVGSTEGPVSVTKEMTPHRMSTEEDIIGSTKGHISLTTNPVARQSPTREKIVGNNEVFSMDIEISTHQPSTEHDLISSPEVPLSLTTISDTHKTSTKDNIVGSTEGPIPLSTQAAIHHMSKENSRRTEEPLFMTTETAAHLLSTEVNVIGSTEAPMFVTEHIIKQTSSEIEKSLRTMNTVLTTARATSLRSSSHDEASGHSEVPKSVIVWHQSNELNTPKTERPTTFPSTSLIPEDSTRATPVPYTGRDTSQVHARHPAPGVFQARRQGPLQSDRRGAETDGTRHDSNFLPLYGSGSRKNQNSDQEDSEQRVRIYVVVPCVLGFLLSLCGLLYYRQQTQILRRQLQQAGVRSERQEEGPLQRLQRDELEVEMDEV